MQFLEKRERRRLRFLFVVISSCLGPLFFRVAVAQLIDLGTLDPNSANWPKESSSAAAVSNGQVVGTASTASGVSHAFSWTQAGGMVDLGTLDPNPANWPKESIYRVAAVSNGQVVGTGFTAAGDRHAFSWTKLGGMKDLGTLGGNLSEADAVSNGQVVGQAYTAAGAPMPSSGRRQGG